jgi:hypothetical protein
MKISVALLLGLAMACGMKAAEPGGKIIGASLTNKQMALQFESTNGYSYQVQANPTLNNRFWTDALPLINGTGNVMSVFAPAAEPMGFFKVLEFTNQTFWYDWNYYYQSPFLNTWGLGTNQNAYAHQDRSYDWYIDQADTGTYSGNNCGPSSVTMGCKWFDPDFSRTAEDARNTYPEGGGWWYTYDIINYLNLYSIPNTTSYYTDTNQFVGLLDQGNVAILCIDTTYLHQDYTSEHRTGRFYGFSGGHFIVVKGYRAVDNALYFEVYDPNNWHAAYADAKPKGRNRHYVAADLENAMTHWWPYLIVIPPPAVTGAAAKTTSHWLRPVDPSKIEHKPGR